MGPRTGPARIVATTVRPRCWNSARSVARPAIAVARPARGTGTGDPCGGGTTSPIRRGPAGTITRMTVPVGHGCLALVARPAMWFVRHVTAVAEVAGWLALRASSLGIAVDRRIISPRRYSWYRQDQASHLAVPGIPKGSAAWLTAAGAAQLADAVRSRGDPPGR